MDRFRPDEDNSIEPSQLTAEEILAQYWADFEQEQAAAREPERLSVDTSPLMADPAPEPPEEDVRVYTPRKQREEAPAQVSEERQPPRRNRRENTPSPLFKLPSLGKKERKAPESKRNSRRDPPKRPTVPPTEQVPELSVADILAEYYSGLYAQDPAEASQPEPEAVIVPVPEPIPEPEPESFPEPVPIPEPEPIREPKPTPSEGEGLFGRAAAWLMSKPAPKKKQPAPQRSKPRRETPPPPKSEAEPAPETPKARRDEDWELDFSHMSIDDILAEFKGEQRPEPAPEESPEPSPRTETAEQTHPSLFDGVPEEPGEAVPDKPAPTRPESKLSRQARDAQRFISQMEDSDYAGIREEEAYNRPGRPQLDWDTNKDPFAASAPEPQPEEESFDPRFRMGGQRPRQMVYDGKALDLSPEEGYVPPQAQEGSYPAPQEETQAPEEHQSFFQKLLSSRKAIPSFRAREPVGKPAREEPPAEPELEAEERPEDSQTEEETSVQEQIPLPEAESIQEELSTGEEIPDTAEGFRDVHPGYAPAGEYTVEQVELPPEAGDDFPSFGQYLMSLFSSLLVRARGYGGKNTASAEADEEDLGPEVSPAEGMKHYASFIPFLRVRFRIGLVLLVIMLWISLGLPVSGALRSLPVASAIVLGLQLCVMLLCLDVVTNAALNLTRLRFGADTLSVFACLLTSVDALVVAMGAGDGHMPLCLISSLSLLGVLLSSLLSARSLRKTLRVPAIGRLRAAVTGEEGVAGGDLTLIKSSRPVKGFVRRTEEMPPDEWLFLRLSPLMLALVLLLGLIVAAVKKSFGSILYIWSALLCPAIPVAALLCFALPFFLGANRNFRFAAAIAGWSGLCDVGKSRNLIVTDRDLFPEGTIRMGLMRILAESKPELILTYAGSMVAASGIGFGSCFAEEMEHCGCRTRQVENFEFLPGGGMRGIIDSQVVLCGSTELMRLMNVWVPDELVTKTSVLLAVDGILQGIFNLEYSPRDSVRAALVALIRSSRHPIFAVRDFNVTPAMLRDCFDLSTDGYDFPPYVDRFALSEASPDPNSKIAALLCREGLESMIRMADTGRGMYTAVRLNLFLTILGVFLGVLFVFTRLLGAAGIGVGGLLLLSIVCLLPILLLSFFLQR